MTTPELIAILVGLGVGWLVVSMVMNSRTPVAPMVEERSWFEVLGVPESASLDAIREVYGRKCREHNEATPPILTAVEAQRREMYRECLDRAYAAAVASRQTASGD